MSETSKCLWCMRKFKGEGPFCCDEHAAKAQVPVEYVKGGQTKPRPTG